MTGALVVSLFLESFGLGPAQMACTFPDPEDNQTRITVKVEPLPSLKDGQDGYRVRMEFDGSLSVLAAAGPITTTSERDVMIRGVTEDETFYTLGLREDGAAALNLMWTRPRGEAPRQHTRIGACENHERHMQKWLTY